MIANDVYEKMVLMSYGKNPRDQPFLDEQARLGHIQEEVEARAKYAREHPPARSHRELELEQRAFNLRMFGRTAMERYARPLDGVDELAVPGDQVQGHAQIKGHNGVEPCRRSDGRLRLQNHAACPQRQVLQLRY